MLFLMVSCDEALFGLIRLNARQIGNCANHIHSTAKCYQLLMRAEPQTGADIANPQRGEVSYFLTGPNLKL